MKGAPGLIVALLLGVLGVAMNYLYLHSKASQVESLSFLGVREGTTIKAGDLLEDHMFEEVRIPKLHAGNLVNYVYQFKELPLVVKTRATHNYREHELLSRSEARTPPPELKLGRGQLLVWVGVDTSNFVPDLLNPGDRVSFMLSVPRTQQPTPAARVDDNAELSSDPVASAPILDNDTRRLGPFTVAAIGSRIASHDLARANQLGSTGGNVIGIYAPYSGDDDNPILDAKTTELLAFVRKHPNVKAGVMLHPRTEKK